MSVSAVQMFYQRLATDMTMRNAFAQESAAHAIRFAAERGYMFTAYDLQVAGENMHGYAKRLGDDMKQLVQHQQRVQSAGKTVGQAGANAARNAAGSPAGKGAGPDAGSDVNHAMANMQVDLILGRLSEVFNVASGSKKSG